MRFFEGLEGLRSAAAFALAELPSDVSSVARWMLDDEELQRLGGAVMGPAAEEVLRRRESDAMRAWDAARAVMAASVAGFGEPRLWR